MTNSNELQMRLLEASDENNRHLARIADSLEELLSMIKGVQPKELAKMAQEHKTAEANKKRQAKQND